MQDPKQKNNKTTIVLIVVFGLIFVGGVVFFLANTDLFQSEEMIEVDNEQMMMTETPKTQDGFVVPVHMFGDDGLLWEYTPYTPASLPNEWGRSNPFRF